MKKGLLFTALLLLLSMILCLNCFATSDQQYIYEIENQTIIFEENSAFDQETKQYIVECLANEYPDAVTYNLLCDLFGHKYETSETVRRIIHCVELTNPRCKEETYNVNVCSRCDALEHEIIATVYISCCPEN